MKSDSPLAARDDEVFRALFEAQLGLVYRTLRRHGVAERDLAEACQDVFRVVYRRLAEFEARVSLRAWIYGIAVRVASSQLRRASARHETQQVASLAQSSALRELENAEQRPLLQLVERALAHTTAERREVFALYELEGMTVGEIALAVTVPENTALARLYRAREDVRSYVERRERGHAAGERP